MARRPANGRPYRPFAGQRTESQATEPLELPTPVVTPMLALAVPAEPEPIAAVPATQEASAPEREAWESMLDSSPSLPEMVAEPIAEMPPEPVVALDAHMRSETDEVLEIPAWEQPGLIVAKPAQDNERYEELVVAEAEPEVTAEVPAYLDEPAHLDELDEVAPVKVIESRRAFETPIFVTPASAPAVDRLLDEVDAAFITAGLPTSSNAASERARQVATLLEKIAQRLRSGEIQLPSAAESHMGSEESALATVLAALLANR